MKIMTVLLASVLLLSGCLPERDRTIPDRTIPHLLTRGTHLWIMVRKPDGSTVEERVWADQGWWIASPEVVE